MAIDRKEFLESLGGEEAVKKMESEERADAIEHHMLHDLNDAIAAKQQGSAASAGTDPSAASTPPFVPPSPMAAAASHEKKYPTAAEVVGQIETRPYRAGAGFMMVERSGANVKRLPPMPANPTLMDFFSLRFMSTANHVLQSANLAMKNGMSEEIILACLLHDVVQELIRTDHGWWGAQLFEPYVPEKVSFAIRYHQALRYYPDPSVGYKYPELYKELFGVDYVPPDYIEETYQMVRKHRWYMEPRLVALNDLYSFDPSVVVTIEPFLEIIGRLFKQPKEGLGNDGSPVAHMWRTIIRPDQPL